ncbi:MAG: 5-(carboxyamino)imidazole ribonucleotide mutase [Bacilli bacterium]
MAKVAVVMGSKNDWEVMKDCVDVLRFFEVDCEFKVVSAHRTPNFMYDYAKKCECDLLIAGAGGAAHLPGMIAALTVIPVIGVPIKSSSLSGIDSLLSIVQMPKGVPVATVAINQAANAGLLAISILSINDTVLKSKLTKYRNTMRDTVLKSVI